jgi:FecR protein
MAPDFYVHRIERISISQSLTDGRVSRASDNSATSHVCAIRYGCRDKSIGFEMNFSNCFGLLSAIGLVTALITSSAHAQTRVGEAAVVKNEVLRVAGPSTTQINVGDGLVRDETVRTGIDSATRLVMADSTNLSLGPNATLKLDRTVFDDEHHYREVALRMTSGAFRFVTGHSDKAAYKITTPLATIGVRGTTLDILSQRGQTIVNLQDGAASVCTVSFECIQLTRPGDTAIITAGGGGRSTIKKTNNPPWTFAATCSASAGLCSKTQYADAAPVIVDDGSDPTGMLCGR